MVQRSKQAAWGRVPVRGAQPVPSLALLSLPYLVPCIRGGLGGEGSGK